ncbi:DUF2384 domain-containing protein [Segetibacter sp. 3557_3]|uniref:type II RES/Xre toxin-antitoxin system antitoxin n=1 Tax=Segetibacter sp. 3557_3 TaxID=2547429 RepID=UPI001058DABF|nr:antitoxin Xre/MbcA/ParS toxin-binding domain-containing protein [Segetibacter sp. 3557_3]TDH18262.1 DUF2384 domain-containing protein [Segetibacter sp. 3557_3]
MKSIETLPHSVKTESQTLDIIALLKEGISYSNFDKIYRELPLTLADWASFLGTTTRTLQRWKKADAVLPSLSAERIVEIFQLYKLGVEVLGADGFKKWLHSNVEALGGKQPIEFLSNSQGINLVRTKLGRIQHGILA